MEKKLLVDFNYIAISSLHTQPNKFWEENGFAFHKHLILNTLISNIKKFSPNEVILAVDDVNRNWRKIVYPEYKANRKKQREASSFNWGKYFDYISEFSESLKFLPFKYLQVKYCEADDVIAVLSKNLMYSENTILTGDKDYIQLLKYSQNKLYNPLKKKFIEDDNPLKTLKIKIVSGDSGDNVPGIKPRVGEKTAIKLIDTGELETLLTDNIIKENYNRNEKLISFDFIPQSIQKEILKSYQEIMKQEDIGIKDYYGWFISHRLQGLLDRFGEIEPILYKLRKGE